MALDKILIANQGALQAKYKAAGLAAIQKAVASLIAADRARGIKTDIIYIDDAASMIAIGGSPVADPKDEKGAKDAVDAAAATHDPDFIVLLDGPDVIPHTNLDPIAGLNDGDATVPSDLPYASTAAWSRQASDFLEVTRVVGRLPATARETDSGRLVSLLDTAAVHSPRPAADYAKPFAITADVWFQSTQLSVSNIFGSGKVNRAPPACHKAVDAALTSLAHFINCHGAQAADEFYGEQNNTYPVALTSSGLTPNLQKDTVATAECCYGAELYDNQAVGTAQPICMAYMTAGAAGYVGSTNIAYGPASGNGQADLLTQYVLQHVLKGATTGRALLQARQDFIRTQVMSSPSNLKTIAQFLLLGDPAIQPCTSAAQEAVAKAPGGRLVLESVDPVLARKVRRIALAADGIAVGASASWPGERVAPTQAIVQQIERIARERGMSMKGFALLESRGGPRLITEGKSPLSARKVAIVIDRKESPEKGIANIRLLEAQLVGNQIVQIEESQSRSYGNVSA
jgi:hypothetical protein